MQKLVNGEYIDLSPEEIAEFEAMQGASALITAAQVNAERERRILAGETFNGVLITGDPTNRANLSDLAFGASLRIGAGDTTTETTFRDGNNIDHDLTPVELLTLWQQAAAYVSLLYAKSWELKGMDPIPADYTSDSYWSAE